MCEFFGCDYCVLLCITVYYCVLHTQMLLLFAHIYRIVF